MLSGASAISTGLSSDVRTRQTAVKRPLLFEPLTIRSVTLKNRIMASPMCQYRSRNGAPTDWHFAHLGRLAMGGAGLVFYEETAVEERGRKTHSCAGLWDDWHIAPMRRITEMIRDMGAIPAIQLGHAGGQASSHDAMHGWRPLTPADAAAGLPPWQPISASVIRLGPERPYCEAMDAESIQTVVKAFRDAALRALDAGFDIIEIHAAHGYLIHQFLSPVTNHRTDRYGGGRENRMRFALEIAAAVRAAIPIGTPLFYRLSCLDGRGGIWNLDDTVALAKALRERGVDVIDCSSGGISGSSTMPIIPRVPGYHVPYARRIRAEAQMMTVAVGLITEPRQAEEILKNGGADIVALARELLAHSEWPYHAAHTLCQPDPFSVFPKSYAYRLRRRHEVSLMPHNQLSED